jgi:hypothetical protein
MEVTPTFRLANMKLRIYFQVGELRKRYNLPRCGLVRKCQLEYCDVMNNKHYNIVYLRVKGRSSTWIIHDWWLSTVTQNGLQGSEMIGKKNIKFIVCKFFSEGITLENIRLGCNAVYFYSCSLTSQILISPYQPVSVTHVNSILIPHTNLLIS